MLRRGAMVDYGFIVKGGMDVSVSWIVLVGIGVVVAIVIAIAFSQSD